MLRNSYQRKEGEMEVKDVLGEPVDLSDVEETQHFKDRLSRIKTYMDKLKDIGEPSYSFIVDTGHPNGDEVHTITEKGIIVIQNNRTRNVVTVLAARPGQVRRYWKLMDLDFPTDDKFSTIIRYAQYYQSEGLNNA